MPNALSHATNTRQHPWLQQVARAILRTMAYVFAILGLSVLIVLHEMGHMITARLSGMRVLTFSIGFGPALLRWRGPKTTYQLALIPLGGYVQIAGMNPNEKGRVRAKWGPRSGIGRSSFQMPSHQSRLRNWAGARRSPRPSRNRHARTRLVCQR